MPKLLTANVWIDTTGDIYISSINKKNLSLIYLKNLKF